MSSSSSPERGRVRWPASSPLIAVEASGCALASAELLLDRVQDRLAVRVALLVVAHLAQLGRAQVGESALDLARRSARRSSRIGKLGPTPAARRALSDLSRVPARPLARPASGPGARLRAPWRRSRRLARPAVRPRSRRAASEQLLEVARARRSVCLRRASRGPAATLRAPSAVIWPLFTASSSASSMRSRVSITMPVGRTRFLRSASRNSATVFASTRRLRRLRRRLRGAPRGLLRRLLATAGLAALLRGRAARLEAADVRFAPDSAALRACSGLRARRARRFPVVVFLGRSSSRAPAPAIVPPVAAAAPGRRMLRQIRRSPARGRTAACAGRPARAARAAPPPAGAAAPRRSSPRDEQVVDRVRRGGLAQARSVAQRGERLRVARRAQVEVAAEHQRVAGRPLDARTRPLAPPRRAASSGRPAEACRLATHSVRRPGQLHAAPTASAAAPASQASVEPAAIDDAARAAHEELVRAALARGEQVGVQVRQAALERRQPVARGEHAHAARARAAGRARETSAAAPPGAAPRPTRGRRAPARTRRGAAG